MSQHSTATAAVVATEESSVKASSSVSGSLKKQSNKNADVTLTDDFVVMSTPKKFQDKSINESNVLYALLLNSLKSVPSSKSTISENIKNNLFVLEHSADSTTNGQINQECLLLSHTSEVCGTPQHVQNILQHFEILQLSQAELLFLLVYVVALESGFIAQSDYEQVEVPLDFLSAICSFHAKNVLRLSCLKPSYKALAVKTRFTLKLRSLIGGRDECSDLTTALLTAIVMGDLFIVGLTPADSTAARGFNTSLSIGRYVLSTQFKHKPVYARFRKLDELSNILRDKLYVPMRCQHIVWLEYSVYPALDGLPVELYDQLFKYLNQNQLKILANVNQSFSCLTKSSKYLRAVS